MKRIVFLSFFIFLGLQVQAGETTSKTEAILASTIEVAKKNDYVWGDFVQLNKSNPALLKKLAELKFPMNLLSSGKSTRLERSQILKVIKTSEVKALGLLWQIPENIELQITNQASANEIERKITNQLKGQCESCDFEITIEKLPNLSANQWKINVTDVAIKSSVLVPLDADGKNLWVSVRIKAFKEVPVATRLLQGQQKIQPGDLELKRKDITNTRDGFLSVEQMTGMSLARSVSVGTVVGASDVKREAAIKKGQMIKALIESADFEIYANATAEEAGFIGDTIKVRSTDNQKIMMGKIKDNNNVVIQ